MCLVIRLNVLCFSVGRSCSVSIIFEDPDMFFLKIRVQHPNPELLKVRKSYHHFLQMLTRPGTELAVANVFPVPQYCAFNFGSF
jgi:hypothetical protein